LLILPPARHFLPKAEFLAAIWKGVTVEEKSLTKCISVIRKALGEAIGTAAPLRPWEMPSSGVGRLIRPSAGTFFQTEQQASISSC